MLAVLPVTAIIMLIYVPHVYGCTRTYFCRRRGRGSPP